MPVFIPFPTPQPVPNDSLVHKTHPQGRNTTITNSLQARDNTEAKTCQVGLRAVRPEEARPARALPRTKSSSSDRRHLEIKLFIRRLVCTRSCSCSWTPLSLVHVRNLPLWSVSLLERKLQGLRTEWGDTWVLARLKQETPGSVVMR
jgi:hypothetical protein